MYRTFSSSADWAEGLMVAFAVVSLVLSVGAALRWRRDRLVFGVFAAALVAPLLASARFGWDEPEFLCLLFLESSLAGMIAYSLLRWKDLGFSPVSALGAGAANAILSPLFVAVFGKPGIVMERGLWTIALVPAALFVGLLIAAVACAVRAAYRSMPVPAEPKAGQGAAYPSTPVPAGPKAGQGAAGDQEQQAVLKMVADGKVSPDEASELLAALGQPSTPADRLPMSVGTLVSLIAGVMIATGFVLPWAHLGRGAYQAGHHIGFLGWLILVLGLLPAFLACVPALDRHLRQGVLRLLLACTGLAFVVSLAVRVGAGRSASGVGLVIVALGFGVQVPSALIDLLSRPRRTANK